MLKWIARKILHDEIESLEESINTFRKGNIELCEIIEEGKNKQSDLKKQIFELKEEKERLANENEILRKYYELDKEPSDKIKAKIHIDLEINRLKEENMKFLTMARAMPAYYLPVPIYSAIGGLGSGIQSTFRL